MVGRTETRIEANRGIAPRRGEVIPLGARMAGADEVGAGTRSFSAGTNPARFAQGQEGSWGSSGVDGGQRFSASALARQQGGSSSNDSTSGSALTGPAKAQQQTGFPINAARQMTRRRRTMVRLSLSVGRSRCSKQFPRRGLARWRPLSQLSGGVSKPSRRESSPAWRFTRSPSSASRAAGRRSEGPLTQSAATASPRWLKTGAAAHR